MSLTYVIDGYNLINHPLFVRNHKEGKLPQLALLNFIKSKHLTGSSKNTIYLVFDGYRPFELAIDASKDNNMIFSCDASADDKIRKIVEQAKNKKEMMIVSDDRDLCTSIKHLGAKIISIEDFVGEKQSVKNQKEKLLKKQDLNYSQIDAINKEMRDIWLKD